MPIDLFDPSQCRISQRAVLSSVTRSKRAKANHRGLLPNTEGASNYLEFWKRVLKRKKSETNLAETLIDAL